MRGASHEGAHSRTVAGALGHCHRRDPQTGERRRKWHSFKGTKREAQIECAKKISSIGEGSYVERSKATVGEFVRARIDQWEAAGDISARTAQRYRQLLDNQIIPHLGAKPLQKLKRLDIEGGTPSCATQAAPMLQAGSRLERLAMRIGC
jgi:hypothetical protein